MPNFPRFIYYGAFQINPPKLLGTLRLYITQQFIKDAAAAVGRELDILVPDFLLIN